MKRAISFGSIRVVVVLLTHLALTAGAGAGLTIEWNFNDGDAELDIRPAGTSKLVNLKPGSPAPAIDGGTVNPGGVPDLVGHKSFVRAGSFSVGSGTGQGMHTKDDPAIAGEDSTWRTYMQPAATYSSKFGPATFHTIFKPNFSGSPTSTHMLLSMSTFNGSPGISLGKNNESRMVLHSGVSGPSGNSATAVTSVVSWDNTAWYMAAGSMGQGFAPTVYLRKLTGTGAGTELFGISSDLTNDRQTGPTGGPFTLAAPDGNPDHFGPGSQPFYLGGSFAFTSPDANFGANGTFALAQVFDEYTGTQAGYQALYFALVPEPTAAAVLLAVALFGLQARPFHARRQSITRSQPRSAI